MEKGSGLIDGAARKISKSFKFNRVKDPFLKRLKSSAKDMGGTMAITGLGSAALMGYGAARTPSVNTSITRGRGLR